MRPWGVLAIVSVLLSGCVMTSEIEVSGEDPPPIIIEVNNMQITSPAFSEGERIPKKFTCDGEDINPSLDVSGFPQAAKTMVLIMDDPDSPTGTWDHWLAFNIPPGPITEDSGPIGVGGKNSWDNTGYGGPCPGSGEHRYLFKVYALDTTLALEEGAKKADIEAAMEGHILDKAQLMGRYIRG